MRHRRVRAGRLAPSALWPRWTATPWGLVLSQHARPVPPAASHADAPTTASSSANHYIAFRLLAHIRDLVFGALRQLARQVSRAAAKGELVSLVTSDIELLEVFYAHTISPIAIALVCTVVFEGFCWL